MRYSERIYTLFEKFIEDFLINKNSILTADTNVFTEEGVDDCLKRYNENYDDSSSSFDQKVIKQFDGAVKESKLIFAHAEWLWAFSVDDISRNRKRNYAERLLNPNSPDKILDVFPSGFGSVGQWHTNNKYWEILFNLKCFKVIQELLKNEILESNVDSIKQWYEDACLFLKYGEIKDKEYLSSFETLSEGGQLAQTNIILHISNPDKYERIASNAHKNRIATSFNSLIPNERRDEELNTDEKILIIRGELESILNQSSNSLDFYEDRFQRVWNYSLTDEGYDVIQGLQYKKAIVLYGPPGTSKTYSAKHLAESLITNEYLKDKRNVIKFFKQEEDFINGRIHHLQLHPNYTYEDFVAGYQLRNHETVPVKGLLFDICEKASVDINKPHVLILDEINRIDLSRLFGEVFSALENRDEPIQLSIGNFSLTIPSNLYVIGTMNEIDFSLERIDFALRRRFIWFFYGYNSETLRGIIVHKDRELNTRLKMDVDVERFIRNATALNQKISNIPELGNQYQIGHTFFGEIVDIYKGYKEIGGYKSLKHQLYRNGGASEILWNISIQPMLISFLGNMDSESKDSILREIRAIYFQG